MQRRPILITSFVLLLFTSVAQTIDVQNYRTYDGSNNNLSNPDWGAAGSNLELSGTVGYANLIDEPAGADRPNPRQLSNLLFSQDGILSDPLNLSDFCWVWGQFIDHDIGLTPDGDELMTIDIPTGDDWFDPFNTGQVKIFMHRNVFDETTGTNTLNPRRHPNILTAYIDGSGVYGSDEDHANWLRSFEGGKLKTSAGNLPPYNTYSGEFEAPIDPNAPHMDNATGIFDKLFVCGDPRANENPVLLSFHTLFVREHNRLCDELAEQHPDWNDEQLYQHARKIVGGLIQSVVYDEWLPATGIDLPAYEGYDDQQNAQLMNVFTAAAFRLGHTLLNGTLLRMDNEGNEMPEGNLSLRDAFFNPQPVVEMGIEPFFKGMAVQVQQTFDSKVVDDIRNFLFGPPGAGGLDLAAININRGRERGLPDYNTIRDNFGLQKYVFFQQINPDPDVYIKLVGAYQDINNVDPWVGMLAEQRMPGALFGPTVMKIMETQFQALRDGDRFYYLNDPVLTQEEKDAITNTNLHDIIMRNTGITLMQDNVFEAMPHEEICSNMTADVSGLVTTEEGQPVADAMVNVLNNGSGPVQLLSSPDGEFLFIDLPACDINTIGIEKDEGLLNGVSTADLIFIQRHILGVELLESPYKLIAADANNSGSITALDQIVVRKAILGLATFFPNNTSWRFIPADYEFTTEDPLSEDFPDFITINSAVPSNMNVSFIGVKIGDVTGDVDPGSLNNTEIDNRQAVAFKLQDMTLQAGQEYDLAIRCPDVNSLSGYQFELNFDPGSIQFIEVREGSIEDISSDNFGVFPEEGVITSSWVNLQPEVIKDRKAPMFYLRFKAQKNIMLSEVIRMGNQKTRSEAYDGFYEAMDLHLAFQPLDEQNLNIGIFELYQNQPNPFRESTLIPFYLMEDGWIKLSVFDVNGKLLLSKEGQHQQGYHEWKVERRELGGLSGTYFYQIETNEGAGTLKMIIE
jgi:hypothetical protein